MKTYKYYHCSPENFSKFSGHYSKIFKAYGIYVCPKFKSMIFDWAETILYRHKKKFLYIYELEIPKNVIDECKKYYDEIYNSKDWDEGFLFSFWLWGEQLFILEEYLDQIKIVRKKKYHQNKILSLYRRLRNKNWENNTLKIVERLRKEEQNG